MSSVKRRVIIEEYVNGGFGILEHSKKDIMGIPTRDEVIAILMTQVFSLGSKK